MKEVVVTVVAPTRFRILSNFGMVSTTPIMDRQTSDRTIHFPTDSLLPLK